MKFWKHRRTKGSGHSLSLLIHIGLVLFTALVIAYLLWILWTGTWRLTLTDDLDDKARIEIAKIVLAIVGGLGGVVFLTIGYRKQCDGEAAEAREQSKHFHERFSSAAEQLGSDAARIRMAGVYGMVALADDWDAGRQRCINVLCAYIRAPYEPPIDLEETASDDERERHKSATEEREIRRAILDEFGDRLRAEPFDGRTWHYHKFDLSSAVIDAGNMSNAIFTDMTAMDLSNAIFPPGSFTLAGSKFQKGCAVIFRNAQFTGGIVSFSRAVFCSDISFEGTKCLAGEILFNDASVLGGCLDFSNSEISGCKVMFDRSSCVEGQISFTSSKLLEGTISFDLAKLDGVSVMFSSAECRGVQITFFDSMLRGGQIDFSATEFHGGSMCFNRVKFSGIEGFFTGVKFWDGYISFSLFNVSAGFLFFDSAKFYGGQFEFFHSSISGGIVSFDSSEFGECDFGFHLASYSGGELRLNDLRGRVPSKFRTFLSGESSK